MNPQITPQVPPDFNTVSSDNLPVQQKSGCLKKSLLILLFFICSIIVLAIIIIFVVPFILRITAKDIPPINDKDILPITIKVPDQDNAFFDLDGIKDVTYETCTVFNVQDLKKCDDQDTLLVLDKNKQAFAKWDSAAQKRSFQDPLYQDLTTPAPYKPNFPYLSYSSYQKLARLNTLRGLNQIKQGNSEVGLNILFETLTVGQKIQTPGSGLLANLVGISLKSIGFQGLQMAAGQLKFSHDNAIQIENKLDTFSFDVNGLKETFKQEYLSTSYLIDSMVSGKIVDIYPNSSTDSASIDINNKVKSGIKNNYLFQPNRTKSLAANWWRAQINNIDSSCTEIKQIEAPQKPSSNLSLFFFSMFYKQNGIGEILQNISALELTGVVEHKCTQQVELDATKVLFAMRAYQLEKGSLPAALDQLAPTYIPSIPIDPYDNAPLKYSASSKVIYSVGEDKKDDGGKGKIHDPTSPDYVVPINF